jgi:potassium efflux system protein
VVQARQLYEQTLNELGRVKTWEDLLKQYAAQQANSKPELDRIKKELAVADSGRPLMPERPAPQASLADLESKLSKNEADLKRLTERLAELDAEATRRAARLMDIPKEITSTRDELSKVDGELLTAGADDSNQVLQQARRTSSLVRQKALSLKLEALQIESETYERTSELLRLERELATAKLGLLQTGTKRWREIVLSRRQSDAEQKALQARQAAFEASPSLKFLAEDVSQLAEHRTQVANEIARASEQLDASRKVLVDLSSQFKRAQKRIETIGLSDTSGQILRDDRDSLPDLRTYNRQIREREKSIQESRFDLYELEDRKLQLVDLEAAVQLVIQELPAEVRSDSKSQVRQLLQSKREHLNGLIQDHQTWGKTLLELNDVEGQVVDEARGYATFIDERVLWVRSTHPLQARDIPRARDALHWLLGPANARQLAEQMLTAVRDPRRLAMGACLLLGWICLVLVQKPARRRLGERGDAAQRRGNYQFGPTLQALGLTIIISLIWPALATLLAWWTTSSTTTSEYVASVAWGLFGTGLAWLPMELVRQTCRPRGLADSHLDWPTTILRIIRRNLRWINLVSLPLLFVMITMQHRGPKSYWSVSLGRPAFILLMILAAGFLARLLYARHGALSYLRALRPNHVVTRTSGAWAVFLVATPLVLIILAAWGYYDTVLTLGMRLHATGFLIFLLALANSLVARGILMRRRKLAIEQAKQRRAAEPAESRTVTDMAAPTVPIDLAEDMDLGSISHQTRQLVSFVLIILGLIFFWFIWSDVLPALSILKRFPAWPGAEKITVASLLSALVVMAITYTTTRNVAGLLELTLLNYLPVDRGARYATTSLCRYLVLLTGVLITAQTLGLEWESVQWLVAAMGIGLGFGLQEIFANFVSGIVLLFERPLRVGDIVTLGDSTGVVTKIRIRATTITDWDRKELIVPNKDLITGRLLNWTLSDQQNRIVIPVGVGYNTDIEQAQKIILDVAANHKNVLKEPVPTVTFDQFGESALNLTLRCHLPDFENRLATVHELHSSILRALREAQVEIAFPQRDLHIRGQLHLTRKLKTLRDGS